MINNKIKVNTSAEYVRRINKSLDFINKHLDQSIQLDDVAKTSHFSSFHFHRIFNYLNDSREDGYVEMDVYIKVKDLEVI